MTKKRTIALALAMVGVLSIGGIMAYFTDGDTTTNTFTVGKVSIDLQEPNWIPPTDIIPEQEIVKDPQIKNDGINNAYVFAEVVVPYKNVVVATEEGAKQVAADTELFTYTVNAGWVEVGTPKKDTNAGTVTHLYAYGAADKMTSLAANATTPALFDAVKFVNVVEDQGLESTTQHIIVNAYAIQTDHVNNGDVTIDGTNADGKVAAADVWAVLSKQAPTTVVTATEAANTDIKQ